MTVSHFVGSDPRCASLSSLLATDWMDGHESHKHSYLNVKSTPELMCVLSPVPSGLDIIFFKGWNLFFFKKKEINLQGKKKPNSFILNLLFVVNINTSCQHQICNQHITANTPGFSLYITAFTVHAPILGSCWVGGYCMPNAISTRKIFGPGL